MGNRQAKPIPEALKCWGAGRTIINAVGQKDARLTTLPTEKQMMQIQKKVQQQYPFLTDVRESMLICDKKLPDCPIIYVNDLFERMSLYSREEILGRNCRFLQGRYTSQTTVKKIRRAVDQGLEVDVEILNYRKDGLPFWNRFLMLPVRKSSKNKKSKVTHFLAIQKDVTVIAETRKNVLEWNHVEVAFWLENAGYPYGEAMVAREITGEQLTNLTAVDLEKIGVPAFRHRGILKKIAELQENQIAHIKTAKMTAEQAAEYSAPAGDEIRKYHTTLAGDAPSTPHPFLALQEAQEPLLVGSTSNSVIPVTDEAFKRPFWSSTAAQQIAVKCCYNDNIVVFVFPTEKFSLRRLQRKIKKHFHTTFGGITYEDFEGDRISITNKQDLANIGKIHDGSTMILFLSQPLGAEATQTAQSPQSRSSLILFPLHPEATPPAPSRSSIALPRQAARR